MPIWYVAQTSPAAITALMIGGLAFVAAVIIRRREAPTDKGPEKRDKTSLIGIGIQGLGIAMASGPVTISGSSPLTGWLSVRTLLVVLTMAGAVTLFVWASRTMGRNWSIVARVRADHDLITTGPFALVRHPIYTGMLLLLFAIGIATAHERALPFAVPLFVAGTLIRTSREEALLRAQFGAAYVDYARRVKRFIPGVI
jgi:protein-S-isoprenylcysteine O-methyltransferase Ste14